MKKTDKTILIIDDDVDFAESIATFLELHGYGVWRARDGDEGVAMASLKRPDLILCDIMMKERTEGFFTVQRLRRTPGVEQTPIVMVSSVYAAVPEFQTPPDAKWLGHNEFLAKPLDPDQLLASIERCMLEAAT